MKCDELKQEENPIEWGLYYDKNEVDDAIAELKARIHEQESMPHTDNSAVIERLSNENERLKAKLESVQATAYTESVDAGMRERKLKRALWLARAKRNRDLRTLGNFRKYVESLVKTKLSIYHYPTRGFPGPKIHKWMMDSFETWCKYLKIAEDKCLKKAEEYK